MTEITSYPGDQRVFVPVTVGRRYAFLWMPSGRVDLGTTAARTPSLELEPIPAAAIKRDLAGRDVEQLAQLVVDQAGGRVVHIARWDDGSVNVLVEAGLDEDRSGRRW